MCTVDAVEPLGDQKHIYLKTKLNKRLIAVVAATNTVQAGQVIDIYLKVDKAHVFEPGETGVNLMEAI